MYLISKCIKSGWVVSNIFCLILIIRKVYLDDQLLFKVSLKWYLTKAFHWIFNCIVTCTHFLILEYERNYAWKRYRVPTFLCYNKRNVLHKSFLDILSLYCHSVVGFVLMCVLHFSSIQHEVSHFISMRPMTISKYFTWN